MANISNFEDVAAFHEKFGVPARKEPGFLMDEQFDFKLGHLKEELGEFEIAHRSGDLEGAADALVDLVYVALGTAYAMGLPWQRLWDEVQRANMRKARATDASESKRGSALDVVKPVGWRGPDHRLALGIPPFHEVQVGFDGDAAFALVGHDVMDGHAHFVRIDEVRERWPDRAHTEIYAIALSEARRGLEEALGMVLPLACKKDDE